MFRCGHVALSFFRAFPGCSFRLDQLIQPIQCAVGIEANPVATHICVRRDSQAEQSGIAAVTAAPPLQEHLGEPLSMRQDRRAGTLLTFRQP